MIEIPKALRTRPRDRRGYPIPFIVMLDKDGLPHFPINEVGNVLKCVSKRLCGLCGKRLHHGGWFIGGVRCFTHPQGAFLDPPSHEECARFAIQACPYLAAPNYAKRIDTKTLKPGALPEGMWIATAEDMPDSRPETFGLGWADHWNLRRGNQPGVFTIVVEEWNYIEFWRHGKPVEAPIETPA